MKILYKRNSFFYKRAAIQLAPLFLILLVGIGFFSLFIYENTIQNGKYTMLKNQLDATNLSVIKNANQEELSRSGNIAFTEDDLSGIFLAYHNVLEKNFSLDSSLNALPENTSIKGKIIIEDLRIYSVKDGQLKEWNYNVENNSWSQGDNNVTPNGKKVTRSSIYSKIRLNTYTVFNLNNSSNPNLKTLDIESYSIFLNKYTSQ